MGFKLGTKPQTYRYIIIFSLFMVALTIGLAFTGLPGVNAATYNYAEALQKAIYFYECQISGPKPGWSRVEWRGPSGMTDSIPGGWYDSGNPMKFGLPMAYSASMLGWAMYEYRQIFQYSGQDMVLKNNLKFILDYFVKCDQGGRLVYQVGDTATATAWWGPVECVQKKMNLPSYAGNGSCVVAQTAAALAIGSIVLGDSTYLNHARSLFSLADSVRSDAGYTAANNFYNSWSGFWDELMWAATWLFLATGDSAYVDKAESYISYLNREPRTAEFEYKWAHYWDDCHVGAFLLLARITGREEYHHFMRMHLDYWTVGYNGERIRYTPSGLAWLDTWGSLRYATTEAFIAFLYSDNLTDASLKARYQSFAINQVNYALGNNARNSSYMVGFGSNAPKNPRHATSHGSWCDNQGIPPNHRHILYGALVGGPDSNDNFMDNTVTCDYNTGLIGALARMYILYGGTPLSNFPLPETRDDEFFMEVSGSSGSSSTDAWINAVNHSAWPARLVSRLSYNYYVDLSELFAAGYSTSDVQLDIINPEIPVTVSPLTQWSGNVYYVKITFTDGTDVWPGGVAEHSRQLQLRLTAPVWSAANDYSATGMTSASAKTSYITMYDGATLIWGNEPPKNTPTPVPTIYPTPTPVITATPVNTATPAPVPTATPVPAGGYIKAQFFNMSTASTTNMIYLNFRLINTYSCNITLSKVKIRYYYTIDGVKPQTFWSDWSNIGSNNVTGVFKTMVESKPDADTYLEIGFTSGAGSLAVGGTVTIQARISKSDWTNYNQTNDFSFNASAGTHVDWPKVFVYMIEWGTKP